MGKKRAYLILGSTAVIAIIVILAIVLSNNYRLDQKAKNGRMKLEKLQEKANKENFNLQILPVWEFETGDAKGELFITNSIENNYKTQVTVLLDEDERKLYQSDIMKPGDRIRYGNLLEILGKGTYAATAYFTVLDIETEESIGKVAAAVEIQIKN